MPRQDAPVSEVLTEVAEARRNGQADPLQDRQWVLANEQALLDAIVEQQTVVIWQPFSVPRIQVPTPDGPKALEFRIRGLSQPELDDCERRARVPTGQRLPGGRAETKRNDTRYGHLCIVAATHPDDAARLWKSDSMRARLKVADVADVVGKVLLPGEAGRVSTEIAALSGFVPSDDEVGKA